VEAAAPVSVFEAAPFEIAKQSTQVPIATPLVTANVPGTTGKAKCMSQPPIATALPLCSTALVCCSH
jgi:hypothetical protein